MKYCLFIALSRDSKGGFLKQSMNINTPIANMSTFGPISNPEYKSSC